MATSEIWHRNPNRHEELDEEEKGSKRLQFVLEHRKQILQLLGLSWALLLIGLLSLLVTVRLGLSIPLF